MRILYELPRQSLVCISHTIGSILVVGIQCLPPGNRVVREGIGMMLSLLDLLKASDIVKCDGTVIEYWEIDIESAWNPIRGDVIVISPTNSEILFGSKSMQVDLVEGKAVIDLVDACGDVITRTYEFLVTSHVTPDYMTRKLIGAE